MKKLLLLIALLLFGAGYVFLQTTSPAGQLASIMPSGALLCLESPDVSRLLRDWDTSQMKADWLGSANYAVFSHSNLFTKLQEVYGQYGNAAGFLPDLKGVIGIAGTDSALALYEIREIEFLYVTRIANADFTKSELWAVRDKFEQRQAGGVSFYLRTDPVSKRTVAFAFAKGYLLLATRDDLVAQALELMAGGGNPSIASDRWFHEATAAAPNPGELRLVMNLDSLVKSVYFRSYWVQRNVSAVHQYWAGVADVKRTGGNITESRIFLRTPEAAAPGETAPISDLLALVPPEAGLYKASRVSGSDQAATLIVQKLIGPEPHRSEDWRYAPQAISPDGRAGNEGDLETRVDQQPVPSDAGVSDSVAAVRAMIDKSGGRAFLLVQSSSPATGTFIQTPSVIVLDGAADWDHDSVRSSLTIAAGRLWTTSQLGAGWIPGTAGRNPIDRLDGLGILLVANQGRLLFLGNDSRLFTTVLDRMGTAPSAGTFAYAAGFRHSRERSNYERVMAALDFASVGNFGFQPAGFGGRAPAFFSDNIGGLSRVLAKLVEVRVTEEERSSSTVQTVIYQMGQ